MTRKYKTLRSHSLKWNHTQLLSLVSFITFTHPPSEMLALLTHTHAHTHTQVGRKREKERCRSGYERNRVAAQQYICASLGKIQAICFNYQILNFILQSKISFRYKIHSIEIK